MVEVGTPLSIPLSMLPKHYNSIAIVFDFRELINQT